MNAADIISMFEGIDDSSREVAGRRLRNQLATAIGAVNRSLAAAGKTRDDLCPQPRDIMAAFRHCPYSSTRCVILGQDPYIRPGEAQGLSFSSGVGIPPSMRNIHKCLVYHGFVAEAPSHGSVSGWAAQGVLLLNCALTTVIAKSNAHAKEWAKYTDGLIRELAARPNIIFILLGGYAQGKRHLIEGDSATVLEWGHPSPLNVANQTDNPKHFMYCDAFTRTNDILVDRGEIPINWDPDYILPEAVPPVVTAPNNEFGEPVAMTASDPRPLDENILWVFTDGGASSNGGAGCIASWAFYMTDGVHKWAASGRVANVTIAGKQYTASNNRGELTAILNALKCVELFPAVKPVVVVSDSEYSIKCITEWVIGWKRKGLLDTKANTDLILPAHDLVIKRGGSIVFRHIRSHKQMPAGGEDRFLWLGNDMVDRACTSALCM